MQLKLQFPTKNVSVNQSFGENATPIYAKLHMKGHNGIDFFAPDGTPVFATHDGTVTYAGLDGSNGNLIVIKTDVMFDYLDGQAYYKTLYGHLKTGTYLVTAGDKVKAGQQIAQADNTGESMGSHLHFGLKPVQQGEKDWEWFNLEQHNGYNGAINPSEYFPKVQEFTKSLKFGDSGYDVEKLQAFLLRKGLMQPIQDGGFGLYGKKTANAVYTFMKNSGKLSKWESLYWRGYNIGKKTLEELNRQYTTN